MSAARILPLSDGVRSRPLPEAFLPLFCPADLTDPVTARSNAAELAVRASALDPGGTRVARRFSAS
jgi:hypothetical protein